MPPRIQFHALVASSSWIVVITTITALLLLSFGCERGHALKVPFRVNDVLPVLPREISWPVLNNLHSAVDLLPYFVGSLTPANASVKWKGACFFDNTAKIEFAPSLEGATLYLKVIFRILYLFNYHSMFLHL